MSVLSFEKTAVGYGQEVLLSDLSFCVGAGEIVSLLGPNGTGKTTIIKTAAGLLKPLAGNILIDDRKLGDLTRKELARQMSVMLTGRVSTDYFTVYDMVRVGRYRYTDLLGTVKAEDDAIIREAMRFVQIEELADRDFNRISDGQKQRVLLARAIVSEPKILILDEPASFLDIGYKIAFFEALKALAKNRGIAVLLSMHEPELARKTADKVICIGTGHRVDAIGDPEEILTGAYLEKLFQIPSGKYGEYYLK